MIYLDNAATTAMLPEVVDAMMPYLTSEYGNPGSIYQLGINARRAVDKARAQVAAFIKASPDQIVFTASGSEANNLALTATPAGKPRIVTTLVEHPSIIQGVRNKGGLYLSVDETGVINVPDLKGILSLRDDIGLVSVMYINNETGAENPIKEVANLCHESSVLFHTDCVQAAGCCDIDVNKIGCDLLSISSHKIHGPKGAGALFVRDKSCIHPVIYGGDKQEYGLRGGTENVAAIVGFGKACEMMSQNLHEIDIYNSVLKQKFYEALSGELTSLGCRDKLHINGGSLVKHGKILNIRFDGVDSETLLLMLAVNGVCVSSGSACSNHESNPSYVLLAQGLTADEARSSIRISFSQLNTEQEVIEGAKAIASCVSKMI